MKADEPINIHNLKVKFGNAIRSTQSELEELAVQFSLGKAEVIDKFEEIKKEFYLQVQEWKRFFARQSDKEKAVKFMTLLEELNLQLHLGKAEAKDLFIKQKNGILKSIESLESELNREPPWNEVLSDIKSEGEKLKLKLEILHLKFELKKFKVSDDFKNAMTEVKKEVEKVLDTVGQKWDRSKSRYTDFNDEMSLVYKHLKKAIKSL